MNAFLIVANVLTLLAFFVHTFVGDKELHLIEPDDEQKPRLKRRAVWTMTRCGWHWISWDLLMATILLANLNFWDFFSSSDEILLLLTVYFMGYALVWFLTILISKKFKKNFLYLGQWMLLLTISILIYFGSTL